MNGVFYPRLSSFSSVEKKSQMLMDAYVVAGVDWSQLDNTVPHVPGMYNLAEQPNVSSLQCHYRGKKGMAEWGKGEGGKTITEPSWEPGNNSWNVTFTLLTTLFHFDSHVPFVLLFLKRQYQIYDSVYKKN